jgi:UDP-N-acetylmuramyl tripeptide synthase
VRTAARVLKKGGTAKPGEIALKICPELLSVVSRGVETVVVTGTNGKTTTCRMLEQAMAEAGRECVVNRSGANLMSGIVTELVMECDLRGRCRKKYAVMECDEGWTKHVLPAMTPRAFVVTNLFQDQVDRYGDVSNTLAAVRAGVEGSPETVLVLNADEPVSASLGVGVPNRVLRYGLEPACGTANMQPGASEIRACMRCGAELEYSYVNYAHLGGYRCTNCGFQRETPDVAVTELLELGVDGSRVMLRAEGETKELYVNQPALYNVSNAAACVAGAMAMGLGADAGRAAAERFSCGFGRMEKFDVGAGARMILIKNAAGCNQVLAFLARQTAPFRVVFITNNRGADGTDIGWLDDADFALLAGMEPLRGVTFSGICAAEVRAHVLAAGVDEAKTDTQTDYAALAEAVCGSDVPVFLLPSYTGMMEFRPYLVKKTGGKDFWE